MDRLEELERRVAALEAELKTLKGEGGPADLLGKPTDPMAEVRQALGFWNAMAAGRGLAGVSMTKVSSPRAQAIRRCLNDFGGIEGWEKAMELVAASAFLCGLRSKPDRPWKSDLDFIVRPDKFHKLMEGGYDQDYSREVARSPGLAPGGNGPSRDDLRSGVLAGVGRVRGVEGR